MNFLRYMAVMSIDNIPMKEGLHSIRALEKDIQYVSEEYYTRNRAKLVAIKLASATFKGDYTHVTLPSSSSKLYTLLIPSSNVPMSLNEMTERVVRNTHDNREDIEVLVRNEILVTYPEDEVEIRLTLRDLDHNNQSYHKTFKPNTAIQRLEDSLLVDVKVEDLKGNDIIAWMEMGPKGLTAVTRQVQHHSVRNLARPELTLIGIALDPSTEDLDNTLSYREVMNIASYEDGFDTISKIIADDMNTGYRYTEERKKQVETESIPEEIGEHVQSVRELIELSSDETDSKLGIKSTTVTAEVLSPEEAEVTQTQLFTASSSVMGDFLDECIEEEAMQKYYDKQSDIE